MFVIIYITYLCLSLHWHAVYPSVLLPYAL